MSDDRSLGDPEAIRRLLSRPETRSVLRALEKKDPRQVRDAAQSALEGDASRLNGLLAALNRDPEAKKAMEKLEKETRQ